MKVLKHWDISQTIDELKKEVSLTDKVPPMIIYISYSLAMVNIRSSRAEKGC